MIEIKYLTELNDNKSYTGNTGYLKTLLPISEEEIISLETTYNNGNMFPGVLRELLFIAGSNCFILDYGLNDTQAEMQEDARADLIKGNKAITRPFYVIDVYNAGDQFVFVYLDEGKPDPFVYEAIIYPTAYENNWIRSINFTLSSLLDARLKRLLSGFNPF